jgi:hypothetical protein
MKTPIVFPSTRPKPSMLSYAALMVAIGLLCACVLKISILANRIDEIKEETIKAEQKAREKLAKSNTPVIQVTEPRYTAASRLLASPWGPLLDQIEASRPTELAIIDASFDAFSESIELTTLSPNIRSAHEFIEALMLNGLRETRLSNALQINEGTQVGTKSQVTARWSAKP